MEMPKSHKHSQDADPTHLLSRQGIEDLSAVVDEENLHEAIRSLNALILAAIDAVEMRTRESQATEALTIAEVVTPALERQPKSEFSAFVRGLGGLLDFFPPAEIGTAVIQQFEDRHKRLGMTHGRGCA